MNNQRIIFENIKKTLRETYSNKVSISELMQSLGINITGGSYAKAGEEHSFSKENYNGYTLKILDVSNNSITIKFLESDQIFKYTIKELKDE